MAKKVSTSLNAPKNITMKIPYIGCYEEQGLFESALGVYSKAYYINSAEIENLKSFSNTIVEKKFTQLLNEIPASMTVQFLIHNRLIPQDDFLKKIVMVPNKENKVNNWINKYNKTLTENSDIGHNNVKKNKYFIISVKADSPDMALVMFNNVDSKIKSLFNNIYGIKVETLTTNSRLKIMYAMLNPNRDDFGKKADLTGKGEFRLSDMKKLKLTTKDVIAPTSWDVSHKNYMILNDDTYARAFFVTSVPTYMSNNLISDITNISSNMLFSAIYESVDSEYGFNIASEQVSENVIIHKSSKRDTIKDRKEKTQIKTESMIEENEKAYFDKCALNTFKEAVAVGDKTMLCSFVIVLYADDLDSLDRDTKMLHISTSKFATQVKPLDLQQVEGLQTAMPLAVARVNVKRLFPAHKLATIPPLDIQASLNQDGLFNGLNAINDNLILLNRKNNPNLAGLIAGTEHSGKTFQDKREIFNALISTNDKIIIVTASDDYDNFVTELGGCIVTECKMNSFSMIDHYGLLNADMYSKALMLEALVETVTRPKDKTETLKIDDRGNDTSMYDRNDAITKEVDSLFDTLSQNQIQFNDYGMIVSIIQQNERFFPYLNQALPTIEKFASRQTVTNGVKSRLQLIKVSSTAEKIVVLDFLFNRGIADKQKNVTSWIFVDPIDDLFYSEQTFSFLLDYTAKMNALQNVFTSVIQSSVKLFADNSMSFRFEDFINEVGYYKLLNQGAIERKKYTEILNITNSLVNYITSAELGKGIILTPASNVAFDDNFYGSEEIPGTLYELFKK